jgi:predicted nucleic acid-binding protein
LKLYLDNCCFNRPFDDQTQLKIKLEAEAKLFIQKNILTGNYRLVWSYILDFENSQNPFEQRKETIRNWREVASVDVSENDQIVKLADKISITGVKPKDALHLACAIHAECEYFITTDAKILNKKIDGIKLIDPIEFIKLQEDYGDDD